MRSPSKAPIGKVIWTAVAPGYCFSPTNGFVAAVRLADKQSVVSGEMVDVEFDYGPNVSTLAAWIEAAAQGEEIVGVVIGDMPLSTISSNHVPGYDTMPKYEVLSWADASKLLDYEFYGPANLAECQAVTAWTKSWVIGVSEHDGATWPFRIPRNPIAHKPQVLGGNW